MVGGNIPHMPKWKSAAIELLFKPAALSAALFTLAWIKHVSPPKTWGILRIVRASQKTQKERGAVFQWKMEIFCYVAACFFEADNAYHQWFEEFVENYIELKRKSE
jgi:hypothetical protein